MTKRFTLHSLLHDEELIAEFDTLEEATNEALEIASKVIDRIMKIAIENKSYPQGTWSLIRVKENGENLQDLITEWDFENEKAQDLKETIENAERTYDPTIPRTFRDARGSETKRRKKKGTDEDSDCPGASATS